MDNIETTVKRVLDSYELNYEERQVADQVIRTLVEREYQIAENLFSQAQQAGIGDYVTREALESCGLQLRAPALHAVPGDEEVLTEAEWRRRNTDLTDREAATERAIADMSRMIDERVAQWKRELGI